MGLTSACESQMRVPGLSLLPTRRVRPMGIYSITTTDVHCPEFVGTLTKLTQSSLTQNARHST